MIRCRICNRLLLGRDRVAPFVCEPCRSRLKISTFWNQSLQADKRHPLPELDGCTLPFFEQTEGKNIPIPKDVQP